MPVDFLTDLQAAAFGRFAGSPSRLELEQSCWLDDADRALIARHRGESSRLGFGVQLATVRMLGSFLPDPLDVPWALVTFVAGQLGVLETSAVNSYADRSKTPYEHQWEISQAFNYRPWADPDAQHDFRTFLSARAWMSAEGPLGLFERGAAWLRGHKVLLPGASVLARLVSEIRTEQAERLYRELSQAVTPSALIVLEGLLDVPEGARVSGLERLRIGPSRVSVPEVLRQVERLGQLNDLGIAGLDVSGLPVGRLNSLARYGMVSKTSAIRELSGSRRRATLVATVRALTADVADDLCDALDLIVAERLIRRAARESGAARLRSLPRLSRASTQLARAVQELLEVLGDDSVSLVDLRSRLSARVNTAELRAAIDVVGELVHQDGTGGEVAEEMMRRYATVRAFLPALATAAPFAATAGGTPTLAALHSLPALLANHRIDVDDIDLDLLSPSWRRLVVDERQVDRRAHTLAVTDSLHRALRRRDVFVIGGRRWGDPRSRLLADEGWQTVKEDVLTGLQLSEQPDAHLAHLASRWMPATAWSPIISQRTRPYISVRTAVFICPR